jgi:cardiolipin synthase
MTIPNAITICRLLSVPVIAHSMMTGSLGLAFGLFLLAGLSDAVDGFIARHFDQRSVLGAYLDPAADKLMLVTIFVALGALQALPLWLVILVVSRDVLIVMAVSIAFMMGKPVTIRPIFVSKANTAAQIGLAAMTLAELAFETTFGPARGLGVWLVAVLTVLSAAAYLVGWLRHVSDSE